MSGDAKSQIKTLLGRVAGVGGLYARRFRSHMTIVTFHRVSATLPEDALTCSAEKFAAFCDFFRSYFKVLPLAEQVAACSRGEDLGGTLSITFDDGYRDNCEVAAPILRRAGLPATFFVATGFVGSERIAPWDKHLPSQPGWMSWDQVRSLAAAGFEIGNHTVTHLNMGTASAETVRHELEESNRTFAAQLGKAPQLFAYPFGGRSHINEQAIEIVRQLGFRCCVSSCGGLNPVTPDPFHLNRISIAGWFRTPHQFGFEYLNGKLDRDAPELPEDSAAATAH
jgi:peptidoglycan/xylan/chitin deacetylase (PgdA/CDA1 family)